MREIKNITRELCDELRERPMYFLFFLSMYLMVLFVIIAVPTMIVMGIGLAFGQEWARWLATSLLVGGVSVLGVAALGGILALVDGGRTWNASSR